ncbi:MAG: exodeoxyribonuclease VII small subunit [Clostridiales bacterium]|nr:exodeoxyribonuclease VII small subunit [Clostridiales bacterium]
MSKKEEQTTPALEEMFTQIEEIIQKMENGETSLEESFSFYQKGVETLKACNLLLDEVEKKMQILNADGTVTEM